MNKKIKNIIFDFGGVLIDWNPRRLYRGMFKNDEEMEYFLSEVCSPSWNLQQDAGFSLQKATEERIALFPEYKDKIEMFYGRWSEMLGGAIDKNVELLFALLDKYPVYGLTNWSAETFPIARERYDYFLGKLNGIVVSGEEKTVKPNPEIYHLLLQRYDLIADECVFIDDNYENVKTAKEIGFTTIHLADDVNLEKELKVLDIL